jgi:hypothetical protein
MTRGGACGQAQLRAQKETEPVPQDNHRNDQIGEELSEVTSKSGRCVAAELSFIQV